MKISLFSFGGLLKALQAGLIAYGATGLFLIALMDAAFIPLPGGPDVVILALAHHTNELMPLYVVVAVLGSTIGSLVSSLPANRMPIRIVSATRSAPTRLPPRYGPTYVD